MQGYIDVSASPEIDLSPFFLVQHVKQPLDLWRVLDSVERNELLQQTLEQCSASGRASEPPESPCRFPSYPFDERDRTAF